MRVFTVDSFTDQPFKGNPAGVCLLEAPATDSWMQSVAAEIRHSETAFLLGDSLRWFTPTVEVDLCGHATLATAHILYSVGLAAGPVSFSTRSGVLAVYRREDGLITMDFPSHAPTQISPPEGLTSALGVTPLWTGSSRFDLLVEVESEAVVRGLEPDMDKIASLDARGVIVTAPATETKDADFVSRFFAPAAGIPEDPVTGSAHCVLSPYWTAKLGRSALIGAQISARGGIVHTTLKDDRVELAGNAVTVWSGELHE